MITILNESESLLRRIGMFVHAEQEMLERLKDSEAIKDLEILQRALSVFTGKEPAGVKNKDLDPINSNKREFFRKTLTKKGQK